MAPVTAGARRASFFVQALLFFILFPAAVFSQTKTKFASVGELNDFIESSWSDKAVREDLYKLAIKGVKDYPGNAEILGRAGFLEYMLDKGDYGDEKISKAFAMDPKHWAIPIWAFNIYSYIAHNDPDTEKSIRYFRKAMEADKGFEKDGYFYIGYRYESFDPPRYEDAVANYDMAERKGYDDISLYLQRGNCRKNMGRYAEAEKDLTRALSLDENNSWAVYVMASARMEQGDVAGWAAWLERFLKIEDDDFVVREGRNVRDVLQRYYALELNSLADAKRHLEYLLANYPGDKDAESWRYRLEKYLPRAMSVSYTVTGLSAGANTIIVPVQNSCQKHLSYEFNPKPKSAAVYSEGGNTYARLEYGGAPDAVTAKIEIAYTPKTMTEGGFTYEDKNDDIGRYLDPFVDSGVELKSGDPYVRKILAEIIGAETDALTKARLIYDWMQKNVTYKVVFHDSIKEYLERKEGECGGFALIFAALCREAGIPARRVFSPIFEYPDDGTFGSHETSEFYVKGYGWIPVNNTNDQFGSFTDVLSLWRTSYVDYSEILYPDLGDITVTYTLSTGRRIVLTGG